jgi:REP element-mobilizing transposase RayT
MHADEPIAFFITWTVYGTFLQGDERGWRRRRKGPQPPEPKLADWRRERLLFPIQLLDEAKREVVEAEIERLAQIRGWHVWAANARSNHVHVVVTAPGYNVTKVRDQFKANCTRELREHWAEFADRPVWTKGGDCEFLNSEDDLEQAVIYVGQAQDRMGRDDRTRRTGR